jgi:hypothetical protein
MKSANLKQSILFLVLRPIGLRDWERFGLESLFQNKECKLIIGLVTSVNQLGRNLKNDFLLEKGVTFCEIQDSYSLDNFFNTNVSYKAVFVFPFNTKTAWIHKSCSRNNVPYIYLALGPLPQTHITTLKKTIKKLPYLFSTNKAEKLIIGGDSFAYRFSNFCLGNNTKIIRTGSFDFRYKSKLNNLISYSNQEYCVFIDNYLEGHPDFNKPPIDSEIYKQILSDFFLKIKSKYNLKIIVAVHPRRKCNDIFTEADSVIVNKTASLIKNSNFVIFHASTAVNFALLYDIPSISLLLDKSCINSRYNRLTKLLSKRTGSILIIESSGFKLPNKVLINKKKRINYKSSYIVANTKNPLRNIASLILE